MYLAPKKHSFVWRLRVLLGLFLLIIFILIGGGRLLVTALVKLGALLPHYSASGGVSDEVATLRARISDLEHERDVLSSARNRHANVIGAGVSIAPGFFFGDALVLDRGVSDGVTVGKMVTTEDGILLGTIEHSEAGWSSVLLLSRPGSKTTLRLSLSESSSTSTPTKNILTEAEGIGGGEFRIDLPASLHIEPGSVVWSGEYPVYPAGVVDHVDQSPARQTVSVYIRLPISPSAISRVLVVEE